MGEADRVIVLGASGGVGSLVVQLAKGRGAVVWGQTGSQEKAESITAAGADRAVVANADNLGAQLAELAPTIAFDALGGRFTRVLVDALDMGGRIGLYGTSSEPEATLDLRTLYRKGVSLLPGSVPPHRQRAAVEAALDELMAGHLKVTVDEVLPLDHAAEAHRRILTRAVRGKLLLRPRRCIFVDNADEPKPSGGEDSKRYRDDRERFNDANSVRRGCTAQHAGVYRQGRY